VKIGDLVYRPCSLDIIQYKITGIFQYDKNVTMYEAVSTKAVGACGIIKILLTPDKNAVLRFTGVISSHEYESGLGDFVEGIYYTEYIAARQKFYEIQEMTARINMEQKEKIYLEARKSYDKIKFIIDTIKTEIIENKGEQTK